MAGAQNQSMKDRAWITPLAINRKSVVILVVISIILWSSAFILWWQADLDKTLLVVHNQMRTEELAVDLAQFSSRYGMAIIAMVYFIYTLLAFRYDKFRDGFDIVLLMILMFAVAAIGSSLLKAVFGRPRPFVTYPGEINALSTAASLAFPSGHASKSVAMVLPFLVFIPARDNLRRGVKILLAFLALAICYSRVVLGAHFVSDVLAGAGLALICLPLIAFLNNKMVAKMPKERIPFALRVWSVILFVLMLYLAAR